MTDSACNPGFCLLTGRGGLSSFVLGEEAPEATLSTVADFCTRILLDHEGQRKTA